MSKESWLIKFTIHIKQQLNKKTCTSSYYMGHLKSFSLEVQGTPPALQVCAPHSEATASAGQKLPSTPPVPHPPWGDHRPCPEGRAFLGSKAQAGLCVPTCRFPESTRTAATWQSKSTHPGLSDAKPATCPYATLSGRNPEDWTRAPMPGTSPAGREVVY